MSRALILAAGEGTRLRPLTNNIPKCLVPLLGKSLLERQVHTLKTAGIENITIATGYQAEKIESLGFKTSLNPRYADTNMVETLFAALDFIREEGDLVIAYGDIIYQSDNLKQLLTCNDEIALMIDSNWKDLWALRMDNPLEDAETLVLNESDYVIELGKKPNNYDRIQGQYTGLIKIRSDKLKDFEQFYNHIDRQELYDGKDFDNMYMTSFLQLLIDSGWEAKAVLVNNGWLEIDSVEDLKHYESMAAQGQLDKFFKVDC